LLSIRTPLQEQQDFIDSDYQAKLTEITQPAITAIKEVSSPIAYNKWAQLAR